MKIIHFLYYEGGNVKFFFQADLFIDFSMTRPKLH